MTHRVGAKGQVVIPKSIREEIGISPGDEVTFRPDGNEVRVRRVADDPQARERDVKSLRGLWRTRRAAVPPRSKKSAAGSAS